MTTKTKSPPRSLAELTREEKDQVVDWLGEMSPRRVQTLARKEFGVRPTLRELDDLWLAEAAPRKLARGAGVGQLATALVKGARGRDRFSPAIALQLRQEVFERLMKPGVNPDLLRALLGFFFKARQQEVAEKRLALARDKHRAALQAIQVRLGLAPARNAKISQAEITAIMDRLDEALGIPRMDGGG
jgi:hypothetical protein